MSPTSRTLALFRKRGYTCQVVERWNPFAKRRIDLFGFIDVVCISKDGGIIGIQCTSASNHATRRIKIIENPCAHLWTQAGGAIYIVSWKKVGRRWVPKEEQIYFTQQT